MSAIVDTIQKIVSDPDKISEIHRGSADEYFFRYAGLPYSILKRDPHDDDFQRLGAYLLYAYADWKGKLAVLEAELLTVFSVDAVSYHSAEMGEAAEVLFARLYRTLQKKTSGSKD